MSDSADSEASGCDSFWSAPALLSMGDCFDCGTVGCDSFRPAPALLRTNRIDCLGNITPKFLHVDMMVPAEQLPLTASLQHRKNIFSLDVK